MWATQQLSSNTSDCVRKRNECLFSVALKKRSNANKQAFQRRKLQSLEVRTFYPQQMTEKESHAGSQRAGFEPHILHLPALELKQPT